MLTETFLLFALLCGLPGLGFLGLILVILIRLGRKHQPTQSANQGKKKAPHSANNEPYLPIINVRGGPDEWQELLSKLNLQTGETKQTIEAKAYVMVQTIRSIESAFYMSLWVLSKSASAAADGLDEANPIHLFAEMCQQAAQDWEVDVQKLRSACLERGIDNAVALECIVSAIVDWLERLESLADKLSAVSAERQEDTATLKSLQNQLNHLLDRRECLRQRDFSWLAGLPRTTFVNVDELQRTFSDHFKPLGQPAMIPSEDIIARRSGKMQVNPVTQVTYSFGWYRDFDCLEFQIKVVTYAGARPVITNWRLLSTLQTIKLAPYVCEYCGDAVEGQSWTCSECGYDILYHATHPETAPPAG